MYGVMCMNMNAHKHVRIYQFINRTVYNNDMKCTLHSMYKHMYTYIYIPR